MSEDLKDKQDDAATGDDAQASDAGAGSDTGAQATAGGADAGKTFTQAEVDKIAQERAAREKRASEKREAELQAKIADFEAKEEEARKAALSEDERKEEARKAAEIERDAAKTELANERTARLRAEAIAADPVVAAYPKRYKDAIAGTTPEEIAASIAEIKAEREADVEAIRAGSKAPPPDLGSGGDTKAPAHKSTSAQRAARLAEIRNMTDPVERSRALREYDASG